MNTDWSNWSIRATTVSMNKPDWTDHAGIVQSVALELQDYIKKNPPPVKREIYARVFQTLREYADSYNLPVYKSAGGEHLKCWALMYIIDNLHPYIFITHNKFNTDDGGVHRPAVQIKVNVHTTFLHKGKAVNLFKFLKISSVKVDTLLSISEKAMSILKQYRSEQEIQKKIDKEQRQAARERQRLLEKEKSCCTLL